MSLRNISINHLNNKNLIFYKLLQSMRTICEAIQLIFSGQYNPDIRTKKDSTWKKIAIGQNH